MVIKMFVGLMIAVPAWYTLYYSAFVTISIGICTVFIFIGTQKKDNIRVKFNNNTETTIPLKYKWEISKNKH